MASSPVHRRVFFGTALTMLAAVPSAVSAGEQAPEAGVYGFSVPPHSTLWGTVTFLGEQMVEVTIRSKDHSKSERGRFDGKRVAELSWVNTSSSPQSIQLVAKVVDGNRELSWGSVKFAAEQHLFLGFGHRPKPVELSERHGGYPHDAVFVGFVVFAD